MFERLVKVSKRAQKPIIIASALVAVAAFAYALGFMTDLYELSLCTDKNTLMYVEGAEVYLNAQEFNRTLFNFAFCGLLIAITPFLFFSQKRRFYYLSNYITTGAVAVSSVASAVCILANVGKYRAEFLRVDFEGYKIITQKFTQINYVDSTFFFDVGYVVAGLLLVSAVLLVFNAAFKFVVNKRERAERAAKIEALERFDAEVAADA